MFKPSGYHYGSVWPLFTGWTALAEYRFGNYLQGFSHIMNNLNVYRNWGLGFVEEVLNGAEYQPSGVCPHQCWSETMVVQPIIEGMLGIEVDARKNILNFSPSLPADWDYLSVQRIRLGDQDVNVSWKRDSTNMVWQFYRSGNQPVKVNMMLALPPKTMIEKVRLNGKDYPFATFTTSRFVTLQINFVVTGTKTISIEFNGGISVLPLSLSSLPGDQAGGLRIIDANVKGDQYIIDVEGLAGTSDTISVWSYYPVSEPHENASFFEQKNFITKYLVMFDAIEKKYVRKSILLTLPTQH